MPATAGNVAYIRPLLFSGKPSVEDPYKQLPSVIETIDESELENISNTLQRNVADGGAAMMAYAYLKFAECPYDLTQSTR